MEQASFIWRLALSNSPLNLGQLPIFNFRGFQRHEVLESSFAVKFFNSGTSSFWGHNHFPHLWQCACLRWVPPAMWLVPPMAAGSTFLGFAIPPLDSIYVLLKFYSRYYHPSFLCHTSIFVGQSLLSMNHFDKMSHGFFTGREESTTCFAICVRPEWWMLSHLSLTDLEGSDVVGHWLWWAPAISIVIVDWRASTEICPLGNYLPLVCRGTKIRTVLLGD